MNKRLVLPSVWPDPNIQRMKWMHDESKEIYKFWGVLETKFPEFSMTWSDGEFGGYQFTCPTGTFTTTEGVRGIGYQAVLAFDSTGTGFVFLKD